MTDKTIIDGVDVSGCEFFTTGNHNTYCICNLLKPCEKYPFCRYKEKLSYQQSARKDERIRELEQENRRLKDELACIQVNCKRNGVKYNNSDFKVFYECSCLKDVQKLSQIAQHCKTVQNRHSKGNDYMFASEILEILAQGE